MESKKTIIVGLVLALAVAWLGTATSSVGVNDQFGAWPAWPPYVPDCTPCMGERSVDCYDNLGFTCNHQLYNAAVMGDDGSGRKVRVAGNYPCSGSALCYTVQDTDCN